jgi:hypothetical protein
MGMDIRPVQITALFDIGRDTWSNFTQSYGGYIDWMERTLSIQAPTIIFTEEKFKDRIWEKRKPYDVGTEFVITTKEELAMSKLVYPKLSQLMESDEFKKRIQFDVPEMTKPWYNIMMFNKVWWLKEGKSIIDGTHYIWTDAACYREDIRRWNKPFPTEKMKDKPLFFSHHQDISIANPNHHLMSQMRFIQGGSFVVPKGKIDCITEKYTNKVIDCIKDGYIGSDEKIFDLLYVDGEMDWEIIKCGWREYFEALSI